jgi:non-heme chloroperoxidase
MSPGGATLLANMKKYASIPAPALLIFGGPHSLGRWADDSQDPGVREQVKVYTAAIMALTDRQINAIESGVPNGRVVRLAGAHHYVYLSHEADVLREMRLFSRRCALVVTRRDAPVA